MQTHPVTHSRWFLKSLLVLCALGTFTFASPAFASAAPQVLLVSATQSASAGHPASVEVQLSGAPQSCQLQFNHNATKLMKSSSRVTASQTFLTWSWQVPVNARASRWMLTVACAKGTVEALMQVHGHGPALTVASKLQATATGAPLS